MLVNGEVAATLPVPRDQAGMLVARDVSIDPRFITEFNHLNVQLIGHYTQQCEDPSNSSLWATVSNASSLDLTYASLASKPDLAALPQPFFDRRDVRRLELPFVFAQKPSAQTLEAAGAVASWFGSLAGYRGAVFPAQIDNAPLVGQRRDLRDLRCSVRPASTSRRCRGRRLPSSIARRLRAGRLLLVLGRNDAELKTAAKALGMGQNALSGNSATITQLNDLQPRRPYDAPNWLPTDRPVRFGELAEARDLTVSGYDADAVRVNLRVPPDLFMWQTKGVPIDLRYRYTVRPAPDRSSLNISVNNGFVQSLRIPARVRRRRSISATTSAASCPTGPPTRAARSTCRRCCSRRARSCACTSTTTFRRPANATGRVLDNVVGAIDPNSTIDLSASRTTWRCPIWPRSPTAASRSRAWPTCRRRP